MATCGDGRAGEYEVTSFTWTGLDAVLATGRPAIVGLLGGQTGAHFVVVTAGGGGSAAHYQITDPWDGSADRTLASYVSSGYNPHWIIDFTGLTPGCGTLIRGESPSIRGVVDGGSVQGSVTVGLAPGARPPRSMQLVKLSSGTIPKDEAAQSVIYTSVAPGSTVSAEGIYQLIVVTDGSDGRPVSESYRFTIDRTPPTVDLSLLNPLKSGDFQGGLGTSIDSQIAMAGKGLATSYPLIDKPGRIRIVSTDSLSGVADVKYNLDGAGMRQYSSEASFNPILTVLGSGDHSIVIQAADAAGNVAQVTRYFTVKTYVTAPAPPRRPTPPITTCGQLKLLSFSATTVAGVKDTVTVSWSVAAPCPPVSATIVGSYQDPGGKPGFLITWYRNVSTASGSFTDHPTLNCGATGPVAVNYQLAMSDNYQHQLGPIVTHASTPVTIC